MPKYVVRHGVMRQLGVFSTRGGGVYARNQQVIARTHRGLEVGEVLCEASEHALAYLSGEENDTKGEPNGASTRGEGNGGEGKTGRKRGKEYRHGQILHAQSEEDRHEAQKLFEQERSEYATCQLRIVESGLDMQLVDVEHLYGGERIVVYYLSEGRVDFRQLVKDLAKEFQTRIEMRQIGVRDEAKLLADYGDCGKPVCCNTHLSEMPPVSMRMAKLQKTTLDPSKISGRCGRLKCCLRYEYDTYKELQKDLPPVGSEIITENGKSRVLAQEILASQLLVQTESMRRVVIDAADVMAILKNPS
ncbi:MAG: regulatory iron-sulfur-containing complex subunit RicT [Pirellulales bacterium]